MSPLPIATIVIYVLFFNPALYCLWRHGKRGILGWFYVQAFCLLRIIGNAIQLHAESTNTTNSNTLLLNSIGLSPLILAAAGILHEGRRARDPELRSKIEWFIVLAFHMLVTGALGLIIAGIISTENTGESQTDSALLKVGLAAIILSWVLLVIWTAISLRPHKGNMKTTVPADGTKLIYTVAAVVPFIGCREIYAICSEFITSPVFTSSLAIKVCLSVVPEMIVISIFVLVGLWTRNIWRS